MSRPRLVILALLVVCSPFAEATTPRTPVTVRFVSAERADGNRIRIELEAARQHGSGEVTIVAWIADYADGRRGEAREIFRIAGALEDTRRFAIQLSVPRRGTHVLTARVDGGVPGRGFSHAASAYLRVSGSGVELVQPERFRHEENLAEAAPRRKEGKQEESGWQLRVNLTVTYTGVDGARHPLPAARVDIYEDDVSFDDYLGSVALNDDGKVSGSVTIPTDPLGVDEVYLVVFTDNNNRFYLGSGTSDSQPLKSYSFTSPSHRVTTGSTANISYNIHSRPEVLTVWSILNGVWTYSRDAIGFQTAPIDIWYPGGGAPDNAYFNKAYNLIAIGEQYYDGPMVVDHEFGHALQYQLNGEWLPEAGGPHSLCPGTAIDQKLAWVEGYATAFALSAAHSPDGVFHWLTGDPGFDVEHYSCSFHSLPDDEARVAAALWDFVDTRDDCNQGMQDKGRDGVCDDNTPGVLSAKQTYNDAVKGQRDEDVMSYWWTLYDDVLSPAQAPLAKHVMELNWAPYAPSVINSFSWRCVDTAERCSSLSFDGVASWNADAPLCELYTRRNDGPWNLSAEGVIGEWGFKTGPTVVIWMKLVCTGWNTVEQTISAPSAE